MTSPGLHPSLFGIEGWPRSPYELPQAEITAKVIKMLRANLVRDPTNALMDDNRWRPVLAREIKPGEESSQIVSLVCNVPGVVTSTRPVIWRLPDSRHEGRVVRPVRTAPDKVSRICVAGIWEILANTDLLTEGLYRSGPKPISMPALKQHIKAIPELAAHTSVPVKAADFVVNLQRAANSIFSVMTGSPKVPRVTCDLSYLDGLRL